MQTQTNTIDTTPKTFEHLSDAEVTDLADTARLIIEGERDQAATEETNAQTAAAAFKSKPNAETLAAREVQAQLASNSRERAASTVASYQTLFAEEKSRAERRELEQLRDVVAIAAKIDAHGARIVEAFREFEAVVSNELAVLGRAIAANNASADRFNMFERRHGTGSAHASATTLEHAIAKITAQLEAKFGRALVGGNADVTGAQLTFLPVGYIASGAAIVNAALRFKHKQ